MEHTLVLIKPDGVQRSLIGRIIMRYKRSKLSVVRLESFLLNQRRSADFLTLDKPRLLLPALSEYLSSGMIIGMILQGENAVKKARLIHGGSCVQTPGSLFAGTIRHDYGLSRMINTVHASDSLSASKNEIEYFFPDFFKGYS